MHSPRIWLVDPTDPDPAAIDVAGAALRGGALVAFPTETVYGLGADARNPDAIARVFAAKGRPGDNPLIVHVPDLAAAAEIAELTPLAMSLAEQFWPGPLTLVLDAKPGLADAVRAGHSTVAVRVPAHPVALALLKAAKVPVAAPSANRSGRPSPTTAAHVASDLGTRVDEILDGGACRLGLESTVVDARSELPIVLRQGAVTLERLGLTSFDPADHGSASPPGTVTALTASTHSPDESPAAPLAASPGTRHVHYRPECDVVLAPIGTGSAAAAALHQQGLTVGLISPHPAPHGVIEVGRVADAAALAPALYQLLRSAEDAAIDVLVVEEVSEEGIGRTVMDRLRRAAG